MRIKKENSPFEILGVSEDATDDDVRRAYRREGMKFHPDRNDTMEAEEKFKRIQTAYQLIKDEASRRQVLNILRMYRAQRASGFAGGGFAPRGYHSPPPGAAKYDPHEFDQRSQEVPDYFPGAVFFAEMFLSLRMSMRIERMPFKLVLFFPYTLFLNFLHGKGVLEPHGVFQAFFQAAVGATVTDLVLNMSLLANRYKLRIVVNRLVVWALLSCVLAFVYIYASAYAGNLTDEEVQEKYEVFQACAVMAVVLSIYSWFVFCFLFQNHHPTWEGALVWIGVGAAIYFFFFVLL